jgi:L-amino acid N-acyltransferase
MPIRLQPSDPGDYEEMAGIFNYYVEHTFATYTETKVTPDRFEGLMSFCQGYPALTARSDDGAIAGFGLLRPYSPIRAFDRTAELTCFIHPEFTGMGVGTSILAELESCAIGMGISSILATISSLNEGSFSFHQACGFSECGRLPGVGQKRSVPFDIVLMQKQLQCPSSTGHD